MKSAKRSFEESSKLNTVVKNKQNDFGNISTSRKQHKNIYQGATVQTETNEDDTYRSQQAFRKLKNLQFQNDLFMLDMQHVQRRKDVENAKWKIQLNCIKADIDYIKNQIHTPQEKIRKTRRSKSYDSEASSNSSSSSQNSFFKIKQPFIQYHQQNKYLQKEIVEQQQDHLQQTIEKHFQKLFSISDLNDKLNIMVKQYFISLHSIEIDLQNNQFSNLLEKSLKLVIDLIEKLNSIKLDSLNYKTYDPLQNTLNYKRISSDIDVDNLNGDQSTFTKFIEPFQKQQLLTPQQKSSPITIHTEQQSYRQLQNIMKSKQDSSCSNNNNNNNNQTIDKKVTISNTSSKKLNQRCELMPSLKKRVLKN